MIHRVGQTIRGLAALSLVVGIVFGIPAALIVLVGWPLPNEWPSLVQLHQFTQTGVAEITIIKTLAVIVWVAWLQLAVAIVVELVAYGRRRAARSLLLVPGIQPLAARLIAAIALLTATSTTLRTSAALPIGAIVAAAPASALLDPGHGPVTTGGGEDLATAARSQTRSPTTTVTATPRDSWWRLAEHHLGDGMRWREIRNLNIGRSVGDHVVIGADTDQLEPGWRLLVSASGAAPPTGTPPPPEQGRWGEWRVRKGDHFWRIAEQTLTDTWERQPSDQEVVPYWQQLVDANRDRLLPPRDPDLIYPDQQLVTPPPPPSPAAQVAHSPRSEPQLPPAPAEPAPRPEVAPPRDSANAESRGTPEGPATTPRGWQAAVERDHELPPMADEEPADPDAHETRTGLALPVGLTAGVAASGLLAAGVVAALRWRRRNALLRRMPGLRLPTPLPDTGAEVTRLEAAAIPERTLDDLASLLSSIPSDAHPVLVTAADDGAVALLFDDATRVPQPPPPWTLADDGSNGPVGWRAAIGDRGPERSIGLPLLVTLGRTGATTVLANIAAMQHLTLTGPEPEIRRRLRAMSLEVATSRISVPVEVAVAGDKLPASLDRVRHVDNPAAEVEAAVAELEQGVVLEDRTPRLVVCHDNVVSPDLPQELTDMVGVLSAQETEAGQWLLEIQDERIGRLRLPDSGTVELALPEIDPQLVDHELTRLNHGALIDATREAADITPKPPDPSTNGFAPVGGANATQPAWCEVRLLGPVEVARDGVRVEGLTPRTLEVLAYLVAHRYGVTKERLDDAVWAGRAPPTASQRVTASITKLRDILGDGPDGQPLVPRRTAAEPIRLSQHVGCDLDRAFAHLAIARNLPAELRTREVTTALELVRGEPFQDLPASWATESTQRAIIQLQDAAIDAARLYRDVGDFDAAESAIRQGLLLLDPADALYLERAELEKARGHPERVAQIWQQLRHRHAQDADEIAGYVSAPAPETELAFQNLMASV